MPDRVTLSRAKGWRMPENTVKVDRSTMWGNPFVAADYPTAECAVARFRASLTRKPLPHPESYMGQILAHLPELRGKNLACWCRQGTPCHADVLLDIANARELPE